MGRMQHTSTKEEEQVRWEKISIYKVPPYIRELNEKAYGPRVVSFGPYHHGQEHLMPMEKHKRRALLHFLKRKHKPLKEYINSLAEVVQDLYDSYDSLDPASERDNSRFLEMMILDGCFMLEVMGVWTAEISDYAANDPIFSMHGKLHIMNHILFDMLLLENRIPKLVLQKLAESAEFFNPFVRAEILPPDHSTRGEPMHLLDAVREAWASRSAPGFGTINNTQLCMQSAIKLDEAGIQLNKMEQGSLVEYAVSFSDGVLSVPLIFPHFAWEPLMLNFMALERVRAGVGNDVASYVYFLSMLIKSKRDVSFLISRGIIPNNAFQSENAVVELFHSLSKDLIFEESTIQFAEVCLKVNEFCKKPWNKWRANIIHAYTLAPSGVPGPIGPFLLLSFFSFSLYFRLFSPSIPTTIQIHLNFYDRLDCVLVK